MKSSTDPHQTASRSIITSIIALIIAAIVGGRTAHAEIIYSEGFAYGGSNGTLAGKNGGTGFSGAWTQGNAGITYAFPGLTFSDLSVSGGMATSTGTNGIDNSHFQRPLAGTLSGIYYGSFLSRIAATTSSGVDVGIAIGSQNSIPGNDGFGILAPKNGTALAVNEGNVEASNGTALNQGQTYLTLFKIDTVTMTMTAWLLSEAQYNAFKVGGITEAKLNIALLGTGTSQLWARASVTGTESIAASYLNIYQHAAANVSTATLDIDELRLSNECLDEVCPVTLYQHRGMAVPATEGWTLASHEGTTTVAGINDSGTPSWSIMNSVAGHTGLYRVVPTAADVSDANKGWRLTATLRVTEANLAPGGSMMCLYRDGSRSYQMHFGSDEGGNAIVVLSDDLNLNGTSGPRFAVPGGSVYNTYELVYSPGAGSANLFVNGVEQIGNYTGFSNYPDSPIPSVAWGDGSIRAFALRNFSKANYYEIGFSVLPDCEDCEPLTMPLVAGVNSIRLPGRNPCVLKSYAVAVAPSGGGSVVTLTGAALTVGAFNGYSMEIVGGPGKGKCASIVSNTLTTITVAEDLTGVLVPMNSLVCVWKPVTLSQLSGFIANEDLVKVTNPAI